MHCFLRQSYEQYRDLNKLLLCGKYVNLGSAKDLLYEHAEKNEGILYKIFNEKNEKLELSYEYIPENRILNILEYRDCNLKDLNIFEDAFEYLSAERIVPQTTYSSISQDDLLGSHGENVLNFLEKYGATFKVEKIFQDETKNEYLLYYINKWMERIFQGFRLQLSPIAEADFGRQIFGDYVFGETIKRDVKIDNVAKKEHIDIHWFKLKRRIYESNPKHKANYGWGSPMDLDEKEAQYVLDRAIMADKDENHLIARYNDVYYSFRCHLRNFYHGYQDNSMPEDMKRRLTNISPIT